MGILKAVKIDKIDFLLETDYVRVLELIKGMLGSKASFFADVKLDNDNVIWSVQNDVEYLPFNKANDEEKRIIKAKLNEQIAAIWTDFAANPLLASYDVQMILSYPSSSYVFYAVVNGDYEVVLAGWGCEELAPVFDINDELAENADICLIKKNYASDASAPNIGIKDSENSMDGDLDSSHQKNPIKTKILDKHIKKWGIIGFIVIIVIILLFLVWNYFNKEEGPNPLTRDEITGIIKNYQDSLKIEIFDGFYLVPAVWDGVSRNYPMPLPGEEGFNEDLLHPTYSSDDSINANTPQDVIALFKGRLDVVNKDGNTMPLPGVANGIDSLLVINEPFIEYRDDNGLRRVVALLNNDLYYYAGYCGTHDGFHQYVLINNVGKYGLVDENCTILEDFFNEKIVIAPDGYYVKNRSTNQLHNFDGDAIKSSKETSTADSNSKNSLPVLSNFYDNARGLWGYKDENGEIVIPAKFKRCPWRFYETITDVRLSDDKAAFIDRKGKILATFESIDNYYTSAGNVKVKGNNGKYGIYNKSNLTFTLTAVYDEVSIFGDNTNMFPVKKDGKWGYVKAGGEVVIPFKFKAAAAFNSNLAAAQNEDGKWGYIDMSGEYKIQPQYYSAGTMSAEGARVMRSSTEYGYITKSGNLIASWYPYMSNKFVLDRIFVRNQDNLGGFIDKNNKLVIPYQFEETEPFFSEVTHLAKVRFKGMDWYVNTNGAFSIPECIYVDAIDKKRSRDWDARPNRKDTARKKVAKEVVPTEQSIPQLMLRIADISKQVSQEIANEQNNSKPKEERYNK